MFNFGKKKDDSVKIDASAGNTATSDDMVVDDKKGVFSSMKDKVKDKAVEKMLEKQLGSMPEGQKQMLMTAIKNNPDFFEKIAKEIQAETKKGKNQMAASMEIMRKYQGDLQKILSQSN